jgi:hypothetical protein
MKLKEKITAWAESKTSATDKTFYQNCTLFGDVISKETKLLVTSVSERDKYKCN